MSLNYIKYKKLKKKKFIILFKEHECKVDNHEYSYECE